MRSILSSRHIRKPLRRFLHRASNVRKKKEAIDISSISDRLLLEKVFQLCGSSPAVRESCITVLQNKDNTKKVQNWNNIKYFLWVLRFLKILLCLCYYRNRTTILISHRSECHEINSSKNRQRLCRSRKLIVYTYTKDAHNNEVHITQVYVAAENLSRIARYVILSRTSNQDVIHRIDIRQ